MALIYDDIVLTIIPAGTAGAGLVFAGLQVFKSSKSTKKSVDLKMIACMCLLTAFVIYMFSVLLGILGFLFNGNKIGIDIIFKSISILLFLFGTLLFLLAGLLVLRYYFKINKMLIEFNT